MNDVNIDGAIFEGSNFPVEFLQSTGDDFQIELRLGLLSAAAAAVPMVAVLDV